MVKRRSPSCASSVERMACGLRAGNSAEHRPYGHADTGNIALAQDIARHHFARREYVVGELAPAHQHTRVLIYFQAQVSEGDARSQWISEVRRTVEALGPVCLLRRESLGATIVEYRV